MSGIQQLIYTLLEMKFINPFELLGLNVHTSNGADWGSEIRKAKARKLSEIELSDEGYIIFHNQEITKNDLNKHAELLTDIEQREYYLFLSGNLLLTQFLQSGDPSIFKTFRQEAIYKDHGFINFVSPFFAESYGLAYMKALKQHDLELIKQMNRNVFLISKDHLELAATKTKLFIEQLTEEIKEVKKQIENEEGDYDDSNADQLPQNITSKINVECLNLVSNYLQTQRNDFAMELRNLSVVIFNTLDNDEVALDIAKLAMAINTDGLAAQHVKNAFNDIHEIWEQRQEERKYGTQLRKYGNLITFIMQLTEKAEKSKLVFSINDIFPDSDIREVNGLPDHVFTQVRNQLALVFIGLSVAIWENHQDLDFTYNLAQTARKIKTDEETSGIINNSFSQIQEIKRERELLEKYKPVINNLQDITKKVEKKAISGDRAYAEVNTILPINQLNNEGSKANEIKDAFCHLISNLSVAVFNGFHDFDSALNILDLGKQINISSDARYKIDVNHVNLSQMKHEYMEEQLAQIVSIFSKINHEIKHTHIDNINQDRVINVFRDVFSRDIVELVANANNHKYWQWRLFEHCTEIAAKLKKKNALAAIDYFQGIGSRNRDLKDRINQFRAEQENRSSGFWDSIFGN